MAQYKPFNFVSHDGTDENGVRAEVFVQLNRGTVKEIKENKDKGVADVHFAVENLRFPIHGWIRTDNEVFEAILKAKESGEIVEFRIESQRKSGIDRSTPIEELRGDANTARDNTKTLLVGINDLLTDEAVTNPDEDEKLSSGRYKATDEDNSAKSKPAVGNAVANPDKIIEILKAAGASSAVRQPVLDLLASQALFNGIDIETINEALAGNDKRDSSVPTESPRAAFAHEAPAWKEYNTDGRLNLGSSVIAAGVGIESLVYKQLHALNLLESDNRKEVLDYFVTLIFAISDRIQVGAYGENGRVDRAAGSHIRVRGIVYDVIDKLFPLPLSADGNKISLTNGNEGIQSWIASVGGESRDRFLRAVRVSQDYPRFSEITPPASLLGGTVTPLAAVAASPAPVEAPVALPAEEVAPPATEEPKAAPKSSGNSRLDAARSIVESVPEVANPELPIVKGGRKASPKVVTEVEDDVNESDAEEVEQGLDALEAEVPVIDEFAGVYPQVEIKSDDDRPKATAETIAEFKSLISESGFDITDRGDLLRVSRLLGYTFGDSFSKAQNIPDEELVNFIDHYVATGTEGLENAIKLAVGRE